MKYKDLIWQEFKKYNLTPRDNQLEIINNILTAYIDNNKKYVILSAPTGSGKSIIGVIVSSCLAELDKSYENKKSFILMHNKTLQKQYIEFFQKYDDFVNIKGATNYPCKVTLGTAEDCLIQNIRKYKDRIIPNECHNCEYKRLRETKNDYPHIITNYSYFLLSTMYSKTLNPRLLTIYDEIHVLNDIFANHMALGLSIKLFKALIKLIKTIPIDDITTKEYTKKFEQYILDLSKKRVNDYNYKAYVEKVYTSIFNIGEKYKNRSISHYLNSNMNLYKMYNKASKRFLGLYCKYEDLETYKYEHVVDIKEDQLSISPIFIDKLFTSIENSKYHLFMSATINDYYIEKTFNIDQDKVEFIKVDPVFPKESKIVVFINHDKYNYKNMQNWEVLRGISDIVFKLVSNHKHEKGIILTSSFKLNEIIHKNLNYHKSNLSGLKIFKQNQGMHLSDILEQFKKYKNASVLISPSLFEGIDLPDDDSNYQLMIKAPFPSLADKRISTILDKYPKIYNTITLFKIIQGLGRSTRHKDDRSISYCFDQNIKRLFDEEMNIWKDEFYTKTI